MQASLRASHSSMDAPSTSCAVPCCVICRAEPQHRSVPHLIKLEKTNDGGAAMTSSSLHEIAPRLEKLLLMLSSAHDNEVLTAVRAITRTLQTVGADWHDLATGLLPPETAKRRTKKSAPEDNAEAPWRVMVGFCVVHEELLRAREREFVQSLLYWNGDLTERQAAWLTAIYERLRRRGAA
jgi:hypothetical protein